MRVLGWKKILSEVFEVVRALIGDKVPGPDGVFSDLLGGH